MRSQAAHTTSARTLRALRAFLTVTLVLAGILTATASPALAVTPVPRLTLHSVAVPTVFSQAENSVSCLGATNCDRFEVTATNSGSRTADGPVVLTDAIPPGLSVTQVQLNLVAPSPPTEEFVGTCETAGSVRCEYSGEVPPDYTLEMVIYVTVLPGAVSGEAAPVTASANYETPEGVIVPITASTTDHDTLGTSVPFGLQDFTNFTTGVDGRSETQAGAHPYELSTRIDLNSNVHTAPENSLLATSVQDLKDVVIDLPVGFVGSAVAAPKCTFAELASLQSCPANTAIGQIITQPQVSTLEAHNPIYNMVPENGLAAEFAFIDVIHNPHVIRSTVVPTPNGYVLRAVATEIAQFALTSVTTVFYGNPEGTDPGGEAPSALFTNPSDCNGQPLITSIHVDSWQNPGTFNADGSPDLSSPGWVASSSASPAVTGCNQLRFNPTAFTVKPDTATADSPTGLSFDLKLPQTEAPGTLATPPLKNATVTLPAGLSLNPAFAGGLQSCSISQVGWLGAGLTDFSPDAPQCPEPSKIGSVEVTSPALEKPVVGSIYLAAQNENPFHSLLAGYIVIDDPTTGIIVKIPGELKADPSTGQITGVFDQNPQLPFSDLKLRFYGGERGELATPEGCGTYTTTSSLIPWSSEEVEGHPTQEATPSDSFPISAGCTPGFGPAFSAGTTNPQAGAYSPFVLSFSRQDSEQGLSGLTVTLPPGLVGKLAGISQCSDAQLAAAAANPSGASEQANPSCPANSRVGSVQSSAGVGSQPFSLGGSAYLTGPYKGAPYGIAVVVPAVAGPFDLGNVVVRSKLQIDPNDAHVTVTSDNFPTIIDARGSDNNTDGFPIHLRSITVSMDRPQFTLNPTSCTPTRINGTLSSTAGASVPVGSQFQAASCASLKFAPKFSASTLGKASKAGGTSLDVKVGYPTGPLGTYANIRSVKVDLPKQLPSRLTTLQRACVAATFEANPANCPTESDVGMATAGTPLLANPLVGPAYIVSHGGEAFPDLEIVLQGEGIKLILDGNTKIKDGITSSTFKAVPDAPVSSFDLQLHSGKFSILGVNVPQSAHYSLCGQTLNMPTVITAQNGAVIKQTTKIAATGCGKAKALTRPQKLTAALKACHKRAKGKQAGCEAAARKKFGPVQKKKK